jgi:hypothetical protein
VHLKLNATPTQTSSLPRKCPQWNWLPLSYNSFKNEQKTGLEPAT